MMPFSDPLPSRVPKEAKKVFQGVIFDVYQWQQELYDESKTTYEMLKRGDSVSIVPVTVDGKIIVIKEKQPTRPLFKSIPGGGVDDNESLEVAARRELLEETGFESTSIEPWFVEQVFSKLDWNIYIFIARGCKKVKEQQLDPGEKIELEFMTVDQFIDFLANCTYGSRLLTIMALKAKLDPKKMTELKALFTTGS